MEADLFIINIVPKLFNFNLNIHILEGTGLNRPGVAAYEIKRIPSLELSKNPTIDLLYKFGGYGILYPFELVKLVGQKNSMGRFYCAECRTESQMIESNMANVYICGTCALRNNNYVNVLNSSKIQSKISVKLLNLGVAACQRCKKDTEYISFTELKDFSICRDCCEKNINKILNNRVKQFISEDFINKECKFY